MWPAGASNVSGLDLGWCRWSSGTWPPGVGVLVPGGGTLGVCCPRNPIPGAVVEAPRLLGGRGTEARDEPHLNHSSCGILVTEPDGGRNWDTIRKRELQGPGVAVAVLEIPGLCQSGRTRLNREPAGSSGGRGASTGVPAGQRWQARAGGPAPRGGAGFRVAQRATPQAAGPGPALSLGRRPAESAREASESSVARCRCHLPALGHTRCSSPHPASCFPVRPDGPLPGTRRGAAVAPLGAASVFREASVQNRSCQGGLGGGRECGRFIHKRRCSRLPGARRPLGLGAASLCVAVVRTPGSVPMAPTRPLRGAAGSGSRFSERPS